MRFLLSRPWYWLNLLMNVGFLVMSTAFIVACITNPWFSIWFVLLHAALAYWWLRRLTSDH